MNLYLLKFYSYQDRKLWFTDSLDKYQSNGFGYKAIDIGVSFKMNDGITTEQVTNYNPEGYNYLICEIDGVIKSRWYILKATKLRTNQYQLSLKRDTLADYYNNYKDLNVSISRAMPLDTSDVNIFNPESIKLNTIKSEEWEIKDETQVPWIVGYIPRDAFKEAQTIEVNVNDTTSSGVNYVLTGVSDYSFYKYTTIGNLVGTLQIKIKALYPDELSEFVLRMDLNSGAFDQWAHFRSNTSNPYRVISNTMLADTLPNFGLNYNKDKIKSLLTNYYFDSINLDNENGKVILDTSTSTKYKIRTVKEEITSLTLDDDVWNNLIDYLEKNRINYTNYFKGYIGKDSIEFSVSATVTKLAIEAISTETYKLTLDSNHAHLKDQPYDMFCLPYADIEMNAGTSVYKYTKELSLKIAQAISAQLGSSNIYDLQLLPFCPCRNLIEKTYTVKQEVEDNVFETTEVYYALRVSGVNKSPITKDDVNKFYLLWCEESNFKFTLNPSIKLGVVLQRSGKLVPDEFLYTTNKLNSNYRIPPTSVKEFKKSHLINKERFVAPDYSSFFEFDWLMNGGLNLINVECTYMPYSPYIRISPEFSYLFGKSFNDNRGLILKGDYSIPQLTSSWANYKLQNKNYLNTFNMETQYLTRQNNLALMGDTIGAVTGAIGAGVTGASMSKENGLGIGMGTSVASLMGGVADTLINNQTRELQMQQREKQFNYNIENIKAIPYGLSSSGSFNLNRKMFPYIEMYTTTEQEKKLLDSYIELNSMSVNKFESIANYKNWLQASLITNSKLESTIRDDINAELQQGIYKLI